MKFIIIQPKRIIENLNSAKRTQQNGHKRQFRLEKPKLHRKKNLRVVSVAADLRRRAERNTAASLFIEVPRRLKKKIESDEEKQKKTDQRR